MFWWGCLPTARLLSRCHGERSVQDGFFNTLKEAAFVLTGSAAGVMSAGSLKDTMWAALRAGQVGDFLQHSANLNLEPALVLLPHLPAAPPSLPFRFLNLLPPCCWLLAPDL